MVHSDGSDADVIVGEISCQQKFFLTTFSLIFLFSFFDPVKLKFSCYYWLVKINVNVFLKNKSFYF